MNVETLKKAGLTALLTAGTLALTAGVAFAADAPKDPLNPGDTAWMLTSSALVLMMTIPGLGLFYGGMVRKKNVLATLAQSFGATALITVLWMVIGYSLAFTTNPDPKINQFIGGFRLSVPGAHEADQRSGAGADDPGIGLHVLPDDLRDHHPGADRRRPG